MRKLPIMFLVFLTSSMACTSMAGVAEAPWSVTYHDGSGNGFRFWQEMKGDEARFDYNPVRPESSSSGTYSGGEAKQGKMDQKQAESLWHWLRRLEKDRPLHVTARDKGTGAFAVKEESAARKFIIMNGPALQKFNEFLIPFRGK